MIPTIISPTLASLEKEIQGGNLDALHAFWEHVSQESTPLIEESDEAGQYYVTFLYQGDADTENVMVFGGPVGINLDEAALSRLLDTNLWFKTIKTPPLLPTSYYLSKNDTFGTDWQARQPNLEMDKLNKNKLAFLTHQDYKSPGKENSLLTFPSEHSPYVAARPDVDKGTLTEHRVGSETLENERSVWVYTPPGYSADGEKYSLLLMHDGFAYITVIPAPTTLDNLIADGKIPPMVAVFVNSPARNVELACNKGYTNFLVEEILPMVREKYHVTTDPANVTIGGSSLGGLASMYAAFTHPDAFGNVLAQSGSYWWGPNYPEGEGRWLTREMAAADKREIRMYMDYGVLESKKSMIDPAHELHEILVGKGYDAHLTHFAGGHDYPCWAKTLADGLIHLAGEQVKEK